jgi:hypothetical protein
MSNGDTANSDFSFQGAIEALTELHLFVGLALSGLKVGTSITTRVETHREAMKLLGKPDPFSSEDEFEQATDTLGDLESFAKREQKLGFPYLYAVASIRVWTILEATIDDFAIHLLQHGTDLTDIEALKKIKVPVLEYMAASEYERAEYLLNELKQTSKVPLQSGITRFESLLITFELNGSMPEEFRRLLFELWQVRNALVHRNGKIDIRLKDACPWLNLQLGEMLILTKSNFQKYIYSTTWYLYELELRYKLKKEPITSEAEESWVTEIRKGRNEKLQEALRSFEE